MMSHLWHVCFRCFSIIIQCAVWRPSACCERGSWVSAGWSIFYSDPHRTNAGSRHLIGLGGDSFSFSVLDNVFTVADSDVEMLCLRGGYGWTSLYVGRWDRCADRNGGTSSFPLAPSPADRSSKTRQQGVKSHGGVGRWRQVRVRCWWWYGQEGCGRYQCFL